MIGGMVSSTLLTLIVIPAVYAVVKALALRSFGCTLAHWRSAGRGMIIKRVPLKRENPGNDTEALFSWAPFRAARLMGAATPTRPKARSRFTLSF
jgi:hypothetical protein